MYDKIQKYEKLKERVEDIIRYLDTCLDSIEAPATLLKNYYTIDSNAIDGGSLNDVKGDFAYRRKYLKYTVLPEIKKIIKELKESGGM